MKDLTPAQSRILGFYQWYRSVNSYSPTVQEVANHIDRGRTTAFEHIQNLVEAGRLIRIGNYHRNYKPC